MRPIRERSTLRRLMGVVAIVASLMGGTLEAQRLWRRSRRSFCKPLPELHTAQ
jgi:hypothetical protein